MLRTTAVLLTFALVGCYETNAPDCTISCATDDECPGDLTCGTTGLCTGGAACTPIVESCTADEFQSCTDSSTALRCNATGDGTVTENCGAPGCSAGAAGCNGCVADAYSCSDANTLARCSADSTMVNMVESCTLGCADAAGGRVAHCRTISPLHIPDLCDTPATNATFVWNTSGMLDTNVTTSCDMVIAQASGPALCVIRAGTITISASLTATKASGTRVLALVADGALDVTSTIDVSADANLSGPGGGNLRSGDAVASSAGGGGAGFKTVGAAGGALNSSGGGGNGGVVLNPTVLNHMNGGPRPNSGTQLFVAGPGGGGGGLMLVSCKGTVTVAGMIDAGGGGGGGGRDAVAGNQISYTGAGGGGAGGYVVMQGAQVNVTSTAQMYANGGGGGGGTNTNDTTGGEGGDGTRSAVTAAAGGIAAGAGAGNGGAGGRAGASPTIGLATTNQSAGGGGGSTGMFQVYVPTGVTPMVTPSVTSPAFETTRTVPTR